MDHPHPSLQIGFEPSSFDDPFTVHVSVTSPQPLPNVSHSTALLQQRLRSLPHSLTCILLDT
eukprot:c50265_g1_i1 orf=75-260(-)